jgi:hypothetical protein
MPIDDQKEKIEIAAKILRSRIAMTEEDFDFVKMRLGFFAEEFAPNRIPIELYSPKPIMTEKFVEWLKEDSIEDQQGFPLQSLYEIYINSILWEEIEQDLEIPKEHLKVRV